MLTVTEDQRVKSGVRKELTVSIARTNADVPKRLYVISSTETATAAVDTTCLKIDAFHVVKSNV